MESFAAPLVMHPSSAFVVSSASLTSALKQPHLTYQHCSHYYSTSRRQCHRRWRYHQHRLAVPRGSLFPARVAFLSPIRLFSLSSFLDSPLSRRPLLGSRSNVVVATVAKGGESSEDLSGSKPLDDNAQVNGEQSSSASEREGDETDGANDKRPHWAPQWLPTFFTRLPNRPSVQMTILLPLYAIHLFLFSTKGWKFKKALIPNGKNLFQSVGYDSVAGALVACAFFGWRRFAMKKKDGVPVVRNLLRVNDPPWRVPRDAKKKIGQTMLLLVVAYLASGYGAVVSEHILYILAGSGVPLTVATTRAWKVLLGHLMWVYMGIRILRRLKPFFPEKGTWLKWKWRSNWVWWAIGGYYVSALFFNMADVLNQLVLPSSLFEEETVVSKLINPENKDRVAMAIGSIGPCVSAPVFEEVLYRGFLLPALACFLPMWAAIPASSVLFAVHHLNPTMIVPLSMLGFIWAILYAKSGNLIVTILIHAMWNSRVFLGSLLGLGTFTDFE